METISDFIIENKRKIPQIQVKNHDFELDELQNLLSCLSITKQNQYVTTKILNKKICEKLVSDKYGLFDFSDFLSNTLPVLNEQMNIKSYDLNINKGIQEFKAYQNDIEIDGEIFKPTFNIFSSTNTYYPLIISAGLFRQVCSNGLVAPFNSNTFNVKYKHYSKSIDQVQNDFFNRLPFLSHEIEEQIQLIKNLKGNIVSFKEVLTQLLTNRIGSDEPKTLLKSINKFSSNIISSRFDKINIEDLNENQLKSIKTPLALTKGLDTSFEDIFIDKYKIYNLYTEVFNQRNFATVSQENERILRVLMALN